MIPGLSATHILNDATLDGIATDGASLRQHLFIGILGTLGLYEIRLIVSGLQQLGSLLLFDGKGRLVADECPVVLRLHTLHHVAVEKPNGGCRELLALAGIAQFDEHIILGMCRAGLVVVAREVTLVRATLTGLVLTTVAGVLATPVEVHVIDIFQEDVLVAIRIRSPVDACRTTVVMCQQVVVKRRW